MQIAKSLITILAPASLWMLTTALAYAADTLYVGDQLVISVRGGASANAPIVTHIRTGDRVSVLQQPSGDYILIRTEEGLEGWSQQQYLVEAPPASRLLAELQARYDALADQHQQAQASLEARQLELSRALRELGECKAADEASKSEPDALPVSDQRLDTGAQRQSVPAQAQQSWFLAGAGVLLIGMILGWIIGRLVRRRRWEW
mgnify:FL=1